jgi:7,8-dihydroneopterin aldolase/epimerase/oxygenase
MSDRIVVSRLAVYAYHGVLPEEERLGQRFYVSLACSLDLAPAGRADDHGRSLDYGSLAALAHAVATERRFRTIEGLAEAVATEALAAFPRIDAIRVRVEKPEVPIPLLLDGVAVEITRTRRGPRGGGRRG